MNQSTLYSVGWDDCVRTAKVQDGVGEYVGSVNLGSQPKGTSSALDLCATVTSESVVLLRESQMISSLELKKFEGCSVALSPDAKQLAVGGSDNVVHLYE